MDVVNCQPRTGKVSRSSFTKFPAEIRNMIYELLPLKFDAPIIVSSSKGILTNKCVKKRRRYYRTGILRVDKQTYQEASPYFYSKNTFLFGNSPNREEANLKGFQQFIVRVPARHLAAIPEIGISCHFDHIRSYASRSEWICIAEKALKHFTGAMVLRFGVFNWLKWHLNIEWKATHYCLDGGRESEIENTIKMILSMWLGSKPDRDVSMKGREVSKLRNVLKGLRDDEPRILALLSKYANQP